MSSLARRSTPARGECSLCDFTGWIPLWLVPALEEEFRLHELYGWFKGTTTKGR